MSTTHVVQFIEAIRTRTDVQTASLLATSLARWNRYYRFLDTILSRYTEVSLAYVAADEQWRQEALTEERFERDRDLQSRLHLEIESFYIFSKILLDRIADTFGYYFDYPLKKSGSTHTQLTSWFRKVCTDKCLVVQPTNLHAIMTDLQERIGKYRTDVIEHVSEPRLTFGTSWGIRLKRDIP